MILEVTPEIDKKTKDTIVKEIYAEYGCPLFFGAKNKNFDVPVDRFLQQLCKKYNLERISIRNVGSSDEMVEE